MKTILRTSFILLIAAFALQSTANAQSKSFKGIITYSLTYGGKVDPATVATQPKVRTASILGNKQKNSIDLSGVVISIITDGDKKEMLILLQQMGMNAYMKMEKAEIDEMMAEGGKIEITYLDETKTIAGYTCKKAVCINKKADGSADTTTVFYTEELGGEALHYGDNQFTGLKGYPLESVSTQEGMIITATATEIKKGKVKDTDFLLPADFVEFPAEARDQIKAMIFGIEE